MEEPGAAGAARNPGNHLGSPTGALGIRARPPRLRCSRTWANRAALSGSVQFHLQPGDGLGVGQRLLPPTALSRTQPFTQHLRSLVCPGAARLGKVSAECLLRRCCWTLPLFQLTQQLVDAPVRRRGHGAALRAGPGLLPFRLARGRRRPAAPGRRPIGQLPVRRPRPSRAAD